MEIIRPKKENSITVCFASDNNYIFYLAVAIKSLIENSNENNYYEIYYLRGLSYYRRADLHYASLDLKKLLSLYIEEKDYDTVYGLTYEFFDTINEYEETLRACITAYKTTNNPYWLFLAGNSALKNGDVKSADYYFNACLKENSSYANEGFGDISYLNNQYDNAIDNYKSGKNPIKCGLSDEYSNGNGSLMKILPIAFYINKYFNSQLFDNSEVINIIYNVSSLTHSHKRSLIACVIYTAIALNLINDMNIEEAINKALKDSFNYYKNEKEINNYKRIFDSDFKKLNVNKIESSGYVVHTLEASIWILLNTSNYKDAVLKAVNFGDDTDTTAAVTGGLAGLYYCVDNIPSKWIDTLINKELIINICSKFLK